MAEADILKKNAENERSVAEITRTTILNKAKDEAKHSADMDKLRHQQELARAQAAASLERAKEANALMIEEAKREAEKLVVQADAQAKIDKNNATTQAEIQKIEAEGEAVAAAIKVKSDLESAASLAQSSPIGQLLTLLLQTGKCSTEDALKFILAMETQKVELEKAKHPPQPMQTFLVDPVQTAALLSPYSMFAGSRLGLQSSQASPQITDVSFKK